MSLNNLEKLFIVDVLEVLGMPLTLTVSKFSENSKKVSSRGALTASSTQIDSSRKTMVKSYLFILLIHVKEIEFETRGSIED